MRTVDLSVNADATPNQAPLRALAVHVTGAWFRLPDGTEISCPRRAMRRMLVHLATEWGQAPGASLSLEALIVAAWPGEKMTLASAQNRARATLTLLRKAGMGGLLQRHEGGYRLSPDVHVELVGSTDRA